MEVGLTFKDARILSKIQKQQEYQNKFPKDFLSKILLI